MKREVSCCTVRQTMLLSSLQQLLEMSAFWPHTRSKTPPVNCIVNDALVLAVSNVQQTLLRFVNAVHLRLIHSLLDVIPYLVVNRIKVGDIRWLHGSGGMKAGVDCSRNRTVSRARCAGTLCCWKMKKSPDTSCITGNSCCVTRSMSR